MSENDTRFAGGDDSPLSTREAFGLMNPPETEEAPAPEITEPATPDDPPEEEESEDGAADEESADEADAAVPDEEPSGDEGQDDTADEEDDLPPIEPPRSWTKEEKKAFEALPRDLQQSIAERERTRHADIDRRLNEAAQQERAALAEKQAAEQARQHYEQQLPHLVQSLQATFQQEFSDVQSWDDVQKMAQEDPGRYLQWQAMREKGLAIQRQAQEAQTRQQREQAERLQSFIQRETETFLAKAPEFADTEKAPQLQQQAFETLQSVGFTPDEVRQAWTGGGQINVHDHRFQLLVRDAMRYRNAQKAVKTSKPTPKPVPKVQRPGPAPNRKVEQKSEHIQVLDKQLERSGSRDAALALMRARRAG